MKNLNKNQWLAVSISLTMLAYLLFAGPVTSLFNNPLAEVSDAQVSSTGLGVKEITLGSGPLAEPGDILTVHYVGTLEDGRVFDSSLGGDTPFSFTIGAGQVIRGWDEGLIGMRVGGRRLLTISPDYGYGGQGVGSIPPNSILIFQVDLLNVQKSSGTLGQ